MTNDDRELNLNELDAVVAGVDVGHGKEASLGGGWTVGYGKYDSGGSYAYLVSPKGVLTMMPGS
jgi:hypothetical protein